MVIINAFKFLFKSIIVSLVSIIVLSCLLTFLFINVDFDKYLDKYIESPKIEAYNETLGIELPTNGKFECEYVPAYFNDGISYTVFKMDSDIEKELLYNAGFEKTNIYDEEIYSNLISIHQQEKISYKHMYDPTDDYLILNKNIEYNEYYFIYDCDENVLFILYIWI